ncbi:MAG: hypothetical protein GY862_34625 [Gammaproteobacteria bacterium]|nr:hypothetical protein [Gammaproteobacteria bacterium]
MEHIILSGYHPQRISGVPAGIPVTEYSPVTGKRNRFYAYKRQGRNFRKLIEALSKITDKPVSRFRGEYRTGLFRLSPVIVSDESAVTKSTSVAQPPDSHKIYRWKGTDGIPIFSDTPPE